MAQNPVLYAIQNLQSGRSTGAFRKVLAGPALSDIGERRKEAAAARDASIAQYKSTYDALSSQLLPQITTAKTAYDSAMASAMTDYNYTLNFLKNNTAYGGPAWQNTLNRQYNEGIAKQRAATTSYNDVVNTVKTQETAARTAYKTGVDSAIHSTESLGYLRQQSADPEAVAPDVSTGSTLAATDLYSDDLQSQIAGKQQTLQATADVPEDDIVTGALQSSIYSKR